MSCEGVLHGSTMKTHDNKSSGENGIDAVLKHAKRVIVLVVGGTVVLAGLALIVLPGPAIVVIPAGLAILATEFVWAKRLLRKVRDSASGIGDVIKGNQNDKQRK